MEVSLAQHYSNMQKKKFSSSVIIAGPRDFFVFGHSEAVGEELRWFLINLLCELIQLR